MIGLFDWMLKRFGGEEEWRFPSTHSKKTLKKRLNEPENPGNRLQQFLGKYCEVHFDNDDLEVRVRGVHGFIQSSFYFAGKIRNNNDRATIEGRYRTSLVRRIIYIIIFHIYWIFIITFFGALLYKIVEKLLFSSQTAVGGDITSGATDIGIMVFATVGIFFVMALFLKLIHKVEQYGKDKIYQFLFNVCENKGASSEAS